jgi:DNA uptake protein ComE-like DNA-binding protein
MWNSIKDFFGFNKRQERGVFVLSLILIVVIFLNHYAPVLAPDIPKHISKNAQYLQQIKLQAYEEPIKYASFSNKNIKHQVIDSLVVIHAEKTFDPNTVDINELVSIGLPKKIASNINKYRSKGGKFYHKEDLRRIYGMTDDIYHKLEPHIQMKEKKRKWRVSNDQETFSKPKKEKLAVTIALGINSADSAQLLVVDGIGPFYAGEIINYRNRLGGYNNINQLKELYRMDSAKFERMKKQLFLDSIPLKKININTATFKQVLRHPYIDYETTKYIMNKRNKLGKYAALYQLKDEKYFPDELYNKLLPYLSLD